uniref:MSP domain-containing protein n=1 Tax=Chromera velia CCMP2878 TaxID=1169474 RepID=A0A0G4HA19_9ALVE|mmetsp:Transcript_46329/g.91352  ORF Transcript_46329/g.91352 Transcript_46329/m.91352 type:complete len:219 (+) Transcript_46329:204-860(+)|eukprot:Cvel_25564.t1-p1 / transcript=Cvel_25564.t1 / gene=Cvel_25564 / organism=Chromera_velia_CCMP2878 / gene_product=Vesicle-associated protein 2-1, putative / transcript_product=Vesicle-associated protein 2-1, putative / location=Cvel_scaffold2913:10867-11520(-) / protein_length=218 / sequence_SO=supercontig / SO=protein_coding / is_pseudo=false
MSPPNLLKIQPEKDITFNYSLFAMSTCHLYLQNVSDDGSLVAFKIKTTAPKNYLVKPSNGTVKAGETCTVQIVLQPLAKDPEKPLSSDRFLVQATKVSNEDALPRDYWQKLDKEAVQDRRLNVVLRKNATEANQDYASSGVGGEREPNTRGALESAPPETEADLRAENERLRKRVADLEKKTKKGGWEIWHYAAMFVFFIAMHIALNTVFGSPGGGKQ